MKCPNCEGRIFRVLETRQGLLSFFRRRECLSCGRVFKTKESLYEGPIPDGARRKRRYKNAKQP